MTKDEAKVEAATWQVDDVDDKGVPIKRPALFNDYFPLPYPNDKAAANANNGVAPPNLTLMVHAKHGGEDYVCWLICECEPNFIFENHEFTNFFQKSFFGRIVNRKI